MSHDSGSDTRYRVIAIAATLLLHMVMMVVCYTMFLSRREATDTTFNPSDHDDSVITFEEVVDLITGSSYIEQLEISEPDPIPQLTQGSQTPAAPATEPEPVDVMQQRRDEIANKVRFTTTSTTDPDEGDGGDSNTTIAKTNDNTDVIGFEGFSSEGFPRPSGFSQTGTIAVRVTVDITGQVIATEFVSSRSNGPIINNRKAIEACIESASKSKFHPLPGTTTTGSGIISYHFKK